MQTDFAALVGTLAATEDLSTLDSGTLEGLAEVMGIRASDLMMAAISPDGTRPLAYRLGNEEGERFARGWGRSPDETLDLGVLRRQADLRFEQARRAPSTTSAAVLGAYAEGFLHGMSARLSYIHFREAYQEARKAPPEISEVSLRALGRQARESWLTSEDPRTALLDMARYGAGVRALLAEERRRNEQRFAGAYEREGTEAAALLRLQHEVLGSDRMTPALQERATRFATRHTRLVATVAEDAAWDGGSEPEIVLSPESSLQRIRQSLQQLGSPSPVETRHPEPVRAESVRTANRSR